LALVVALASMVLVSSSSGGPVQQAAEGSACAFDHRRLYTIDNGITVS
jgi:hypothetical protein